MRILVIGSGGREHALLTGLAKDPSVTDLHVVPGNDGMTKVATCHPEAGAVDDPAAMVAVAEQVGADLVVIGPEIPLVAGVGDALREAGFRVFGPDKAGAMIEGSKQFAKEVMDAAQVPTARSLQLVPGATEETIEEALDSFGPMWVVKDDGLAAGKGVVVTDDRFAARTHVEAVHASGNPVLLEAFLDGPEVSLFCLVDGETVVPLLPAQDHKRVFDGDEGPNTGGMGAYTPLPWLPADGVQRIVDEVCVPVAKEMVRRGTPYSGLLYAGLAWTAEGPSVIEFNARFGDPETQAVLALLRSPLGEVLDAVASGTLAEYVAEHPLEWAQGYALTVVLASAGYPASSTKGSPITGEGLDDADAVLHAGTASRTLYDGTTEYVSDGGRVLNVMGVGASLEEARAVAYERVAKITFPDAVYRTDIALPAVEGRIALP
ncbi:phosphoribosylamine--glycine ligase [Corynebacterium guangdongense]|uniref:Phosphoribosylamine--glycine ligase n=1 Tax=Corynebacterium guangdongense TaxID=1783348 RepID=A0ABU2A2B3_9CORY|nr:phosphoribosylamine--glycine ligase [Corynebacterium guangdongense]MDR7330243.1 phosphoribosylamine--glycine ligase [Corynebacterium guangdongense]WJZ18801.1 Phosphoribosylamine--glycine ligase [Corynebacterium guangdongense]